MNNRLEKDKIAFSKWLRVGLGIKRWLILAVFGTFIFAFSIIMLLEYSQKQYVGALVEYIFPHAVYDYYYAGVPYVLLSAISLIGLLLFSYSIVTLINRMNMLLQSSNAKVHEDQLIDMIYARLKKQKGAKIVAFGGGTGLSTLLRGLKNITENITAIVTVSDNGGSSGKLRHEFGMIPVGDIRNCLTALSNEETLLSDLFSYRFSQGEGLSGHSMGNLFITALNEIHDDMEEALDIAGKLLGCTGRVLPSTNTPITLKALMEDGTTAIGEVQIVKHSQKITKLSTLPENPHITTHVIEAIEEADIIVFGPGSLYTSILPHLLMPEMVRALSNSRAYKIYIANLSTQVGETDDMSIEEHIDVLKEHAGTNLFDMIIVNSQMPPENIVKKYRDAGSELIMVEGDKLPKYPHINIRKADMVTVDEHGYIRHDTRKLAANILRVYRKLRVAEARQKHDR